MKNILGKFGLYAVGAIAAAGLVGANSQTASAQLELEVLTPNVTADSSNPGLYTWTYLIQLADGTSSGYNAELSNNQSVDVNGSLTSVTSQFTISNFDGYQAIAQSSLKPYGYNPASTTSANVTVQTNTEGDWNVGVAGDVITATYTGNNAFDSDESPNYTATDSAYVADTANKLFEATPGYTLVLGEFQFDSLYSSAVSGNFASVGQGLVANTGNNPKNPSTATFFEGATDTTLVPVAPLPAAFWPGLMTLGGMAVVGGLRLRRRAL